MAKKNKFRTPNSRIKSYLRKLWLSSRERGAAASRDKYTCQQCGVKQSKAKGKEVSVVVHHKDFVTNWDKMYDFIRKELLVSPDRLEVLCVKCHDELHSNDSKDGDNNTK